MEKVNGQDKTRRTFPTGGVAARLFDRNTRPEGASGALEAGGIAVDLGIKGRVAVVAAASKGLGLAVAKEMAKEGARVAICSRSREQIENAAEAIRALTRAEVLSEVVDVRDEGQVKAFFRKTCERWGRIDICVTNSGGPPSKLFSETQTDDWRAAVDLLLMSAVFFAREALPRMKEQKWGRFVAITSYTVKQPADGMLLSNSVRAGVTGLVRTLANEYAPYGITVNNVCPGYTATDRIGELAATIAERQSVTPEEVIAGWEKQIPARRLGTPEEFAAVVSFLASERAGYVNGTSVSVDGGIVRSLF
jgi:3-oxoacyl-[acyl-carrier protein] reductase